MADGMMADEQGKAMPVTDVRNATCTPESAAAGPTCNDFGRFVYTDEQLYLYLQCVEIFQTNGL